MPAVCLKFEIKNFFKFESERELGPRHTNIEPLSVHYSICCHRKVAMLAVLGALAVGSLGTPNNSCDRSGSWHGGVVSAGLFTTALWMIWSCSFSYSLNLIL